MLISQYCEIYCLLDNGVNSIILRKQNRIIMELNFNSVETIANLNASAAFQVDSGKVFKDDVDICPVIIDKKLSYIPWGGDNNLPYHILDLIESDETIAFSKKCKFILSRLMY